MKKRLLCIMLILVMTFGATAPVFAITETVDQGANTKLTNIYDKLTAFTAFFTSWWSHDGSLDQTIQEGTFQSLAINVAYLRQMIEDWVIPRNITDTSTFLGMWDYVWYMADQVFNLWPTWNQYLGNLPSIASYVSSWMSSNNGYLSSLETGLTNLYRTSSTEGSWSYLMRANNAHYSLVNANGTYDMPVYADDHTRATYRREWFAGSPIGNLGLLLQNLNRSVANGMADILIGFNSTLTTWEHSTNTQTSFTPTSLANGLYRYLAYIQSDTSDMDYNLKLGLTNFYDGIGGSSGSWTNSMKHLNAHYNLFQTFPINNDASTGYYGVPYFTNNGLRQLRTAHWANGTPLGNLAFIADMLNENIVQHGSKLFGYFNNSQVAIDWLTANNASSYTPVSEVTGLYYWLKNIQAPIARLAFVHANDDDIAAMRAAQSSGVDAVKTQLYDANNGGVTLSDMTDTFNTGKAAKQTFNSGVGFSTSGLFSFTDDGNWGFWSQAVKDDMDTVTVSTRKSDDDLYDNSAYDDRMAELEKLYSAFNNEHDNRETGLNINRQFYVVDEVEEGDER